MEGQTTAHSSEAPCLPRHTTMVLTAWRASDWGRIPLMHYNLSGRLFVKRFLWGASDGGLATPPYQTTLPLPGMDGQVEVQKGEPCLLFLKSMMDHLF